MQADARYPINPVYCYTTAWQHAVRRLAPDSDAILMDLRGFTWKDRGCVFELTWLVQRVPLRRIVLLADAATDFEVLQKVVQNAWAELPSDSPNATERSAIVTVLDSKGRSRNNRRALFTLLLRAAYGSPGVPVAASNGLSPIKKR